MKIAFLVSMIAGGVFAAVSDTAWCSIETPDSVEAGKGYQVKVTLKKPLAAGENLSCHMHYVKNGGGWGGMYEWRPAQNATVGKPVVFNFTCKGDAMQKVKELVPMAFVAPGGNFDKKTKDAWPKHIGVKGGSSAAGQAASAAKKEDPAAAKPANCTYKKSWVKIERVAPAGRYARKGDTVTLKIKYYLDPTENWGAGTRMHVAPLGPWIDKPDGVVNKSRTHVFIYGFWPQDKKNLEVGEHTVEMSWKVETSSAPYATMGFLVELYGGDGKRFPWTTRGGGFTFIPEAKPFRVWADAPGGLFTYGQPVVLATEFAGTAASQGAIKITDSENKEVYSGTLPITNGKITIPSPTARGVFLCELTIGKDTKYCYFGTIPDVAKALGGKRAPFGCTNVYHDDEAIVAEKLGFDFCRLFTGWAGLEPKRGQWELKSLDETVDRLNKHGISPMILLTGAPEWVMPNGVHSPGFEPFPFDDAGWEEAATHLAKHYSGRIWGFEWLNEILPGSKTARPVEDYVRFCKIGTTAVKKVDPKLGTQMAGGLWPPNFRVDLIRAGIAPWVDILPTHYSDYDGVIKAKDDFAAGGGKRVWDNESAHGYSVWKMDGRKALFDSVSQSEFLLRHWPGEFIAGAEHVVYFGGESDPCGNWTYLLDAHTPRPVAATLAVLATKIGTSRPVGACYLEPGVLVYLFEKKNATGANRGLAFVMSQNGSVGCNAVIPVGAAAAVKVTDYQGNEKTLYPKGGKLAMAVKPMPVILEDFDLTQLTAITMTTVDAQGPLVPTPSVRFVSGGNATVKASLVNNFSVPVAGRISCRLGTKTSKPQTVKLLPGKSAFYDFEMGAASDDMSDGSILLEIDRPAVKNERRFSVSLVKPELLRSLVKNGNFETPGGNLCAGWGANGFKRVQLDGAAPGYEGYAIEMRDNKGYASAWQSFDLPAPGIRYLYTAWVWSDNMYCGSNASVKDPNGKGRDYTIVSCFAAPKTSKGWTLLAKVLDAVPGSAKGSIAPVGQVAGGGSKGWAKYDNIRVTAYEGTEYATEAYATAKPIKIDGDLSDWDLSNPIPLCCENQVTKKVGGWEYSRDSISGVAYFSWDKDALYFACKVQDDVHTTRSDARTPDGDSVSIALHPGNRQPGTDGQAIEWQLSDASPGGGSGRYTLYRPEAHSAGLKSGQLAKDSSQYEIMVKTTGKVTVYELRIPWGEVRGCKPELGAKLGLSLRLTDRDGDKLGLINWGMGLDPSWAPSAFGVLTLTK